MGHHWRQLEPLSRSASWSLIYSSPLPSGSGTHHVHLLHCSSSAICPCLRADRGPLSCIDINPHLSLLNILLSHPVCRQQRDAIARLSRRASCHQLYAIRCQHRPGTDHHIKVPCSRWYANGEPPSRRSVSLHYGCRIRRIGVLSPHHYPGATMKS